MPVLRLFLFLGSVEAWILFHLDNEADLSRVAEVGDSESWYFLNERLTSEFELILAFFD